MYQDRSRFRFHSCPLSYHTDYHTLAYRILGKEKIMYGNSAYLTHHGAIWDCEKEESYAELQKGETIYSPIQIIDLLKE